MPKGCVFHAKPALPFNIFSRHLYFHALIIEHFQICYLLKKAQFKRFIGVSRKKQGVSSAWETSEQTGKEAFLAKMGAGSWELEETIYGALSQLPYLWDVGVERGGVGEGGRSRRRKASVIGELTPLNTIQVSRK